MGGDTSYAVMTTRAPVVLKSWKPEFVDDQKLEESNGNAGKTAATNKVIVRILECIVIFALVMKKVITALKNAENKIHVRST